MSSSDLIGGSGVRNYPITAPEDPGLYVMLPDERFPRDHALRWAEHGLYLRVCLILRDWSARIGGATMNLDESVAPLIMKFWAWKPPPPPPAPVAIGRSCVATGAYSYAFGSSAVRTSVVDSAVLGRAAGAAPRAEGGDYWVRTPAHEIPPEARAEIPPDFFADDVWDSDGTTPPDSDSE